MMLQSMGHEGGFAKRNWEVNSSTQFAARPIRVSHHLNGQSEIRAVAKPRRDSGKETMRTVHEVVDRKWSEARLAREAAMHRPVARDMTAPNLAMS